MQVKLLSTLVSIFFLAGASYSQTYIMSNTNQDTGCSGTLYDSGGAGGNYTNNANLTYTICPSTPGAQLELNFTAFNIENGFDFLTIYNGSGTTGPTLGTYTGTIGPGVVQASNASGCITLVFTSDGSVTSTGWAATVSCTSPCQSIVPNVTASLPISAGTYIDVCQGDVVTFNGSGTYPQNNTSYAQSDATSTFNWTFSDGGNPTGQTVNHTYTAPGIFQVDLQIIDVNGCASAIDIDILVRVSDDPSFVGSLVTNPVICLGETNTLTGVVTPTQIILDCTPPVAGITFLPDGSGVSYSTDITVDCFGPSQTVTSAADIDEICITMEHSYLGDLELEIECPNGQTATLHAYPGGGGTYLGSPNDPGPGGPGTGWEYCFDMTSPTLLVNGGLTPSGDPVGNAITAGSYLPVDNFTNLIGCPLNGDWTINITDNLAADDGYIFGWNMGFNSAIVPAATTYTPAVVSEGWQADPTITATAGSTITVQPVAAGTSCYTYEMTDEFGCDYDTTICFTVLPPTDPACPNCFISTFNALVGACEAGNVFTVTGDFTFQDNPGAGNLIVEVTNGSGTYSQTFTPPFTDGQLYNYSIGNIPSDGTALTVTVYFVNDPACTSVINSISPASCACNVDIGTFSVATTGTQTGNDFVLCFGDDLDITANGDYTPPGIANNPPGPPYSPGIAWLVYSCPPTVALAPDPILNIPDDPCLLGIVGATNLNETNDMFWINAYPPGTFTSNTVYFVPITIYSTASTPQIYSYTNTTMPCYETGPIYSVQYIPEITEVSVEDCTAGTVTTTVTGGQPSMDGSLFTGTNLVPATASFAPGTAADGGTLVVTGLVDGDVYSYDIVDDSGCPITVTGVFVGLEDPAFTYPQTAYCQDDANPSPTITGDAGGTFSSTPGISLNPATGLINLAASTPGTYTVTYQTPDPVCFDVATFDITINPLPVVDGNDETICAGASVTLNGTGADTYTWDNGVLDGVSFTPAATTTYTVTGTITATGCTNTGTATVTVDPLDDPSFTTTDYCEGTANPAPVVTGLAGGTFAFNPVPVGPTINTTTGVISGGVGGNTYTVEYTTNGPCPQTSTQTVTVFALPPVDAQDVSICIGGTATITATGAVTYTWDSGLGAGQSQNVTPAATTNYTVTGTDGNGCVNSDIMTVNVLASAPINAGVDVTICDGDLVTLTATGGVSYNWLAPISAAGAVQNVSPSVTTTYTVDGTDANGCTGTDQVTITVNPLPTATVAGTVILCQNDPAPTITFTGANGTAPYTFTYNINGGANQTVTSVGNTATVTAPTGTVGTFDYNLVSVADANATPCTQTQVDQATVTINPTPTATIAGTITVCEGDAAPTITFTGADGTAPYTFTYNINGGANQTVTSVGNTATVTAPTGTPGTFDYNLVSVSDASPTGCSQAQVDQATVIVNPLPTATVAGAITVCVGDAAPTITFTGANGTAPYTFTYNINGGANQTVVSVGNTATVTAPTGTAGTFDYNLVSVSDASATGCSQAQVDQATVIVNPSPTATIAGTVTVCEGDPAPTITFTGADGTAPYTFTYNINGGANQTVTSVGNSATVTAPTGTPGTFDYNLVSVSDASPTGCSQTQIGTATVTVNPLPTATIAGTVAVCEGDAAPTITFTGANGTAPYTFTYNINGGANQTVVSVGNTATITVPTTPVGTYNYNLVSVSDASATACAQAQIGTATVTVNANPVPVINGATQYCTGTTSTLSTTIPYATYTWSTGATTPTVDVTDADNPITVTVTNAAGCSATSAIFTVTENNTILYNSTVTICQGDVAVIHGNNETVAGVYSQTFVLPTGCDSTSDVTLVVNPLPVIDAGVNQIACDGDPITLNATGAPNIAWDNGVTNGFPFNPGVGTVTYTATGTDANGCFNTDVVDVTINPLPTATVAGTVTLCQNDAAPTITFTGANGTAPYTFTYNINGGANQTVSSVGNTATVTAPTGTVGTFDYNLVSVSDASATACSQAQVDQATVTINSLPTATVAGTITLCQNEAAPTITFTGVNGAAPYTFTYNINGGANQTVTSVGNTATVTAPTGTVGTFDYNLVSVSDASATGCSQAQVDLATVTINPLPTATVAGTITVCQNDAAPTITFTGANGSAPYTFTYNINGGANQTVVSVGNTATVTAPTGSVGTFDYNLVSVSDASATGCSQAQIDQATVTVDALPTATIAGTITVCEGDAVPTITFTGANGTAPYTFTYNINGAPNQTITSVGNTATVTAPTGVSGTFDYNLVSVSDASTNGCSQAQVDVATVTVNPLPTATIAGAVTVCQNDIAPTITFTGANGTAPYTFTYNINGGANQTVVSVGNTATVAAPTGTVGTFDYNLVSVSDASATSCSQAQVDQATVIVVPNPTATVDGTISVCVGDADPVVTFTGANGTAPYTFTYNINNTGDVTVVSVGNTATITIPTIVAGVFNVNLVSVSDASASGCSQVQAGTATVTVNDLPNVSAGNDLTICEGDQTVLTGTGATMYVWDQGVTNGVLFTPATTNTYTVIGTDANGCSNTDDVTITLEPAPIVSFVGDVLAGCEPLEVTFTNTTPGNLDECIWTFGNGAVLTGCGSVTTTFSTPGLYDVTLTTTSTTGCTASATYTDYIYVEGIPNASFTPSSSLISNLDPTVYFDNTSTGAVSYEWDFGINSSTSTEVSPFFEYPTDASGNYTVELIAYSPLGCSDTAYAEIQLVEEVIFYVPNTFTPDDDDYNPTFQPVFSAGYDPYDFTLLIFNRWGEIIFESRNADIGWDGTYGGKLMQDGTYTWKIEFKTTSSDERRVVVGHVNMMK
ncbi:MAG: PKD domain-containing protein [Crocinitomicaceae bacterium]|nr:PKD domain-containing protein [Crocinitomicaceae bacterium]